MPAPRRKTSDGALTERGLEVLTRLELQLDKRLCPGTLGRSYDGVRFRVRGASAKPGTGSRVGDERRARERGILPAHSREPARTAPPPDPPKCMGGQAATICSAASVYHIGSYQDIADC